MSRRLNDVLAEHGSRDERARAVADTVAALAAASAELQSAICRDDASGTVAGASVNAGGDVQKELDVHADALFLDALRRAPVAAYASEEQDGPVALDASAPVTVAIDPLDGSSNIDTNVSIGTIFSVLPKHPSGEPGAAFLQPGSLQLAAGFIIYGPRTALVLTLGDGTGIYILDPATRTFVAKTERVIIPPGKGEYAINASNYRFWDETVRAYVDDCVAGSDGPHGTDFNTRWIASLVAEAYRIFVRGGVFLYPAYFRKGYHKGRLRLVYEANPIAFLAEQAGGAASNGGQKILDLIPEDLHQRTPLVFGSSDHVQRIARYHEDPSSVADRAPLFGRRGLLRV